MTRDEFLSLPVPVQVRMLVDILRIEKDLAGIEKPRAPRSPKFDQRISRKGGYQWASETDLESLLFWLKRYTDSANEGGKHAEKDSKNAERLTYWVSWREAFPDAVWTGQRNDAVVTAAAPSGKPRVHEWGPRGQVPLKARSHDEEHESDDIPF